VFDSVTTVQENLEEGIATEQNAEVAITVSGNEPLGKGDLSKTPSKAKRGKGKQTRGSKARKSKDGGAGGDGEAGDRKPDEFEESEVDEKAFEGTGDEALLSGMWDAVICDMWDGSECHLPMEFASDGSGGRYGHQLEHSISDLKLVPGEIDGTMQVSARWTDISAGQSGVIDWRLDIHLPSPWASGQLSGTYRPDTMQDNMHEIPWSWDATRKAPESEAKEAPESEAKAADLPPGRNPYLDF